MGLHPGERLVVLGVVVELRRLEQQRGAAEGGRAGADHYGYSAENLQTTTDRYYTSMLDLGLST